ncbi:MAG: hypothetical protein M1835_001230 [Candelina submexicana]|nr:MAG: hypothetical protein M1835_001230 [Candelina submexicana]
MSTRTLPEGLVTNSEEITSGISGIPSVDPADLYSLWRVYSTHKHVIAGDVGLRLENLFWRILSKESIYSNITGPTVASLFQHISEGSNFIRTTPTQSPRTSRSLGVHRTDVAGSPLAQRSIDNGSQLAPAATDTSVKPSPPPTVPRISEASTARPPPILKNARGDARYEHKKTARIAPSPPESSDDNSPLTSSTAESRASTTPTMSSAPVDSTRGTRRKKTGFVAISTGNRRRPTVPRRKSSQTPSSTKSSTDPPSPQFAPSKGESPPVDTAETLRSRLTVRVPSAPDLMQAGQNPPHIPRSHIQLPGRRLVEQDFSSRFEARRQHSQNMVLSSQLSATKTYSTVGSTSTAEALGTLDIGDGQSSTARGKARQATFTDKIVPLKSEGTADSMAANMSTEPPARLARTKSQLALVLNRDRQLKESKSGGQKTKK